MQLIFLDFYVSIFLPLPSPTCLGCHDVTLLNRYSAGAFPKPLRLALIFRRKKMAMAMIGFRKAWLVYPLVLDINPQQIISFNHEIRYRFQSHWPGKSHSAKSIFPKSNL